MAAKGRRTGHGLSDELLHAPYRFNFFQAVRLLERRQAERGRPNAAVGLDHAPQEECVRFRTVPTLSFPASAIAQLDDAAQRAARGRPGPPEMVVTFFGLTGPNGVLPRHYTELLIRRVREKDHALRDFLDVFHHRLIALFFRAWEKYRLPFARERALAPGAPLDPGTQALFSLVGFGTAGLRGRLEIDDEAFVYYGGHFSHSPRSAAALQAILEDYFEFPLVVEPLQGQWLYLEPDDLTLMPRAGRLGQNTQVGLNAIVGGRVWDVQSKFRLRVGPLSYAQFQSLMPNGDALRPLCQLTRTFVGPGLEFDVQPVLRRDDVPACRLTRDDKGTFRPHLGWNTWLSTRPLEQDAGDAVFSVRDLRSA
jgi:type VI secretion system protein ImpH